VPTAPPTAAPTAPPTAAPTGAPTIAPTAAPTAPPTAAPTARPTTAPTAAPTTAPTVAPTCSSSPIINQTLKSSWVISGISYSQWDVTIVIGSQNLFGLQLFFSILSGSIQSFWGITFVSGYFTVNDYRLLSNLAVPPAAALSFGYIVNNTVGITITQKPYCNAPANCPISISAVSFLSWSTSTVDYQHYTLELTNTGSYPTNTANITVSDIGAGGYPSSQYNLQTNNTQAQITSSGEVNYVAPFGALLPGFTDILSGFVLATPKANANQTGYLRAPTFTVNSVVCTY